MEEDRLEEQGHLDELNVLYNEGGIVVVNKPSGLLVHRGWGQDKHVAMTMLRDKLGEWVYPIHRLDRGASGALLFALSKEMASALGKQVMQRQFTKGYLALVRGVPQQEGEIDHAIPKREGGPKVEAKTNFRLLGSAGRYSLVEVVPSTGRLHQVRKHMKHISCPLIGDVRYGKGEHNRYFRDNFDLHRLALHCHWLAFFHPVLEQEVRVEAPLSSDLSRALKELPLPFTL